MRTHRHDLANAFGQLGFCAKTTFFCRIRDTFCIEFAKLEKPEYEAYPAYNLPVWPIRKQIWPIGQNLENPEVGAPQGWFWAVSQTSVPAPKDKLFSRHFCLFFKAKHARFWLAFNEKHAWLCLKNKKKTTILNAASQYRVGVFNKSCFFLIF